MEHKVRIEKLLWKNLNSCIISFTYRACHRKSCPTPLVLRPLLLVSFTHDLHSSLYFISLFWKATFCLVIWVRMLRVLHHRRPCFFRGMTHCACTAHVLLRLFVIDQQLTTLAIASWLITSNFDDCKKAAAFAEDAVHLLERAVGCLRIEVIYDRENEGVAVIC